MIEKHLLKRQPLALVVFAVLNLLPVAHAVSSNLVISQVYGGGGNAGATYKNDFIELFNRGNSPVSLNGMSIQYASTAGTAWTNKTDLPNVTLQAGQYYLVQEASGGAVGATLPTADTIGIINMSAAAGKVALVSNQTIITSGTSCPSAANGVVDLIGFGPATNCSETTPTTANLSATAAAFRASNGCSDTDNNSVDFSNVTPSARNTASPVNACGATNPTVTLSVNDVSQNEGNSGTSAYAFSVSLSAPAPAGGVSFDITTTDGSASAASGDYVSQTSSQTIPAGSSSYTFTVTVNGDAIVESNETFLVTVSNVVGATVSDAQATGTLVNDDVAAFH